MSAKEVVISVDEILEDIARASSADPVFTIGAKSPILSEEVQKYMKQQSELGELEERARDEIQKLENAVPALQDKEEQLNSLNFWKLCTVSILLEFYFSFVKFYTSSAPDSDTTKYPKQLVLSPDSPIIRIIS